MKCIAKCICITIYKCDTAFKNQKCILLKNVQRDHPLPLTPENLLLTKTALAGSCASHTCGSEVIIARSTVLVTSCIFICAHWACQAGQSAIRRVETGDTISWGNKERNIIIDRAKNKYKRSDGDVPLWHCCNDKWDSSFKTPSLQNHRKVVLKERWSFVYSHRNMKRKVLKWS